MPSKAPKTSTDIYVKRERWGDGHYHTVARQKGKILGHDRWHNSESTMQVADKVVKKQIVDERSRYTYLFGTQSQDGQPRSLAIFTKAKVFKGTRKKRKLHLGPMQEAAREKYVPAAACEIVFEGMQLKAVYDHVTKTKVVA